MIKIFVHEIFNNNNNNVNDNKAKNLRFILEQTKKKT